MLVDSLQMIGDTIWLIGVQMAGIIIGMFILGLMKVQENKKC